MEYISFFPKPKLLGTSDLRTPFFSWKRKLASPGIDSFKQKLFTDGTSKEFVCLISGVQRPERLITNRPSVSGSWFSGRQINPIECPLNFILDF